MAFESDVFKPCIHTLMSFMLHIRTRHALNDLYEKKSSIVNRLIKLSKLAGLKKNFYFILILQMIIVTPKKSFR